jgi:hypothetical protein
MTWLAYIVFDVKPFPDQGSQQVSPVHASPGREACDRREFIIREPHSYGGRTLVSCS